MGTLAWTQILSKKSLRAFNNSLKNKDKDPSVPSTSACKTCTLMPVSQETPTILSACLVSTEAEPKLRVFASTVAQPDAAPTSKNAKAKPPQSVLEDTSITHIIVFPTRSDAQTAVDQQFAHMGGQDDADFFDLGDLGDNAMEGGEGADLVNDDMLCLLGSGKQSIWVCPDNVQRYRGFLDPPPPTCNVTGKNTPVFGKLWQKRVKFAKI